MRWMNVVCAYVGAALAGGWAGAREGPVRVEATAGEVAFARQFEAGVGAHDASALDGLFDREVFADRFEVWVRASGVAVDDGFLRGFRVGVRKAPPLFGEIVKPRRG